MLFNKWLVLSRDIVVVEERSLVEPVRQMRNGRLHHLKGAIVIDILAVCAQDMILLHLTILTKWRFQTNIVQRRDLLAIGNISDVVNGPLRKSCDTVGAIIVSLILFNFEFTVAFESKEISAGILQTNGLPKHDRLPGFSIFKFVDD